MEKSKTANQYKNRDYDGLLTEEERLVIRQQMEEIESLTEKWEKNLCYLAMIESAEWGKKIDLENKKYKKRNKLTLE